MAAVDDVMLAAPFEPSARRIHGQGTPEAAWRSSRLADELRRLSIEQLCPAGSHVLVVAPHPDDEVLGCGGALSMLAAAGRCGHVAGITDGEASHAGSSRWPASLLASTRREERLRGLRRLSPNLTSVSLGLPDGGVTAFEQHIVDAIERLLRPNDVVLTTWRLDGHPDHEATGRAVTRAAALRGCRCWEMPIWMWHWAEPDDRRIPWHRLRRLDLTPAARDAKCLALAAHESQLQPIPRERRDAVLPDWALARMLRPFETFFEPETSS